MTFEWLDSMVVLYCIRIWYVAKTNEILQHRVNELEGTESQSTYDNLTIFVIPNRLCCGIRRASCWAEGIV